MQTVIPEIADTFARPICMPNQAKDKLVKLVNNVTKPEMLQMTLAQFIGNNSIICKVSLLI
jgi:hypothetical protein